MGLMEKIKGLFGGHRDEADAAVDKAADVTKDAVPEQAEPNVDDAADAVKDQIDEPDAS
jgi:hypothetical protein